MGQIRPRHHQNGNGRGEETLDIQSDSTRSSINFNYAKYGKKKSKALKKKKRISLYVVFIIGGLVYPLAVFILSGSLLKANSNSRQYYNYQRPAFFFEGSDNHPALRKKYKDMSKTQNVNLNDLTTTIAFDHAKYDGKSAYYGGIKYHQNYQREVNNNKNAFGPESTANGAKKTLENLLKTIQNVKGNYPQYSLSDGDMLPIKQKADDASYYDLKKYYDDDNVEVNRREYDHTEKPRACRSTEFEHFYFPTCNNFHEIDLGRPYDEPEMPQPRPENQLAKVRYLGHGYYRDAWAVEDNPWIWPSQYTKEKENKPKEALGVYDENGTADLVTKAYRTMVLKTLRYAHERNEDSFLEVQLEAIIMERLTKFKHIMDIYGHCGFAVTGELVPIEFEERVIIGDGAATVEEVEKRNKDGPRSYNNFTPEEKLAFALEMAESIADLHGFEDGVIVHDDVQLCQWMTTPDGRLKLGDFNRATIMQWDEINGDYCKFNNGQGASQYRAPEEYRANEVNLNEQIDVFSFCNNIYALITGLWNFYDLEDQEAQDKVIDGDLPYVDPRWKDQSYEERKLVELLPKCWAYDPDERISIFDAVNYLRQAIEDKPKHQD